MVLHYKGHHDAVARWMSAAGEGLSNDELVDLLEQGLRAVWTPRGPISAKSRSRPSSIARWSTWPTPIRAFLG